MKGSMRARPGNQPRTMTRRDLLAAGSFCIAGAGAILIPRTARAQTAFDYYIGPNGSDSNPGTLSAPWAITALNSKASMYAGKRVGLLDGTYNIYSMMSSASWERPALDIPAGTSSSPTVVAAVNLQKAIIDGSSGGTVSSVEAPLIGQAERAGYATLDGLVLRNSHSSVVEFYRSGSSNGTRSNGVVVQNCEIYGARNLQTGKGNNCGAIRMWGQQGALIRNNYIHDCFGGSATEHEGYGIITFGCTSCIYEYNTIEKCAVGIYNKQTNNSGHTIRYNYIECIDRPTASALFDNNGGVTGTTYTINNNILVSADAMDLSGMAPPGEGGYNIYNNTFYWDSSPSAGVYLPTSAAVRFYNNIMTMTGRPGYLGLFSVCIGSLTGSNFNCYSDSASASAHLGLVSLSNLGSVSILALAAWRTSTGQDANALAALPRFSDASALSPDGFKLASDSPCRNAGRVGGSTSGGTTDIGAWGGDVQRIGSSLANALRPAKATLTTVT